MAHLRRIEEVRGIPVRKRRGGHQLHFCAVGEAFFTGETVHQPESVDAVEASAALAEQPRPDDDVLDGFRIEELLRVLSQFLAVSPGRGICPNEPANALEVALAHDEPRMAAPKGLERGLCGHVGILCLFAMDSICQTHRDSESRRDKKPHRDRFSHFNLAFSEMSVRWLHHRSSRIV